MTRAEYAIAEDEKELREKEGMLLNQDWSNVPCVLETGDIIILKVYTDTKDLEISNPIVFVEFSIVFSDGRQFSLIHNLTDYGSFDKAKRSNVWRNLSCRKQTW